MRTRCSLLLLFLFAATWAMACHAQDSPSLGDLARQVRQQREQSKAAPGSDAQPPKVITNEQMPEHPASPSASETAGAPGRPVDLNSSRLENHSAEHISAEHVRSQIQAQKNQIATLQKQIDGIKESIRFAPASNCVGRCVQWNERQREKQVQVERMQAELDEHKKHLDEMQESARKQGFGSSVYDP